MHEMRTPAAHVSDHVYVRPAALIGAHRDTLARYAVQRLGFDLGVARNALGHLMRGERALRASRLPQLVYRASRCVDGHMPARFDHYVRETCARLLQVNRLIAGETPMWLPEVEPSRVLASDARHVRSNRHGVLILPVDLFRKGTALGAIGDVVALESP